MEIAGANVLLVEDDYLVAESIKAMLESLGCAVIGPAYAVAEALELIEERAPDLAVLDIWIRNDSTERVARRLMERSCPIIFVTGLSSEDALPQDLSDHARLQKPISTAQLNGAMHAALTP